MTSSVVIGKRSVKRILNWREWRLEAERHGKRASQKSTRPAQPGSDRGVTWELSTKWAKATGVLSATRHGVEHSAKLPAAGANKGTKEAGATVGGLACSQELDGGKGDPSTRC